MALITLRTDFGTQGIYAGAMKGVIQAICPAARVIDLIPEVTLQAIREGAVLLDAAYRYLPTGAIHIAVIDPDVGTARRAIALAIPQVGTFVGPDNGLTARTSCGSGTCHHEPRLHRHAVWMNDQRHFSQA